MSRSRARGVVNDVKLGVLLVVSYALVLVATIAILGVGCWALRPVWQLLRLFAGG